MGVSIGIEGKDMDWKVIHTTRERINTLPVWYLIHQYCFHIHGTRIISDRCYQMIRHQLLWEWDDIKHMYLNILDKEDVLVDIVFSRSEASYPKALATCARLYLKEYQARKEL